MNTNAALFTFPGGIHPPAHKDSTRALAIQPAALPPRLYIALQDSNRGLANATVEIGQYVAKGERIATAASEHGVALHAPTSGHIEAIETHPAAHPSALPLPTIVLASDGKDQWQARQAFDLERASREALLSHLRDSGIVGMGGAMFPTHIKARAARKIHTLILNGAECEPWITCDDRLMRERSDAIVRGGRILAQLSAAATVIIGIEDNKPEAIAAMQAACARQANAAGAQIRTQAIPTCYPAGGEKQLIRVLTGIRIAHGQYGPQYGVQCFNVGTAHAVACAVDHGQPLISRIITLTGAFQQPANFEALLGTPFHHLIEQARPRADVKRYLLGGPMMGFTIDPNAALSKGSNCLIAINDTLFPPPPPEQACIRCTQCAQACPVGLQPFELYRYARARSFTQARELHLSACIECGGCAWVCPSNIPLVEYFRFAKSELGKQKRNRKAADLARQRFEWRTFRLEREKTEKAARMAAKAAETRAKLAAQAAAKAASGDDDSAPADDASSKQALIAAALARAQKAKAAAQKTPAESAPAESTPAESTPAESTPAETAPAETAPTETAPAETAPAESTPAESTPAETAPAETAPAETAPAESTPAAPPATAAAPASPEQPS